jgi:hypothetical protein
MERKKIIAKVIKKLGGSSAELLNEFENDTHDKDKEQEQEIAQEE